MAEILDEGTGAVKPPKPQDEPTTPGESFDISGDTLKNERTVGSGGATYTPPPAPEGMTYVDAQGNPIGTPPPTRYGAFQGPVEQEQIVRDAFGKAVNDYAQANEQQPTGDQMANAKILAGQPNQDVGAPPSGADMYGNPNTGGGVMQAAEKGQELTTGEENAASSYVEDVVKSLEGTIKESVTQAGEAISGQGEHVLGGGTGALNPLERAAKIIQAGVLNPIGAMFTPATYAAAEALQNAVLLSPIRGRLETAFRNVGLNPYDASSPNARMELTNQVLMDAYLHGTPEEGNYAAALLVANGYLQFVSGGGLEMTATGVNLAKNLARTVAGVSKAVARSGFATSEASGVAGRLAAFKDDRLANLMNEVAAREAALRTSQEGVVSPASQVISFEEAANNIKSKREAEAKAREWEREAEAKAPGRFEEELAKLVDQADAVIVQNPHDSGNPGADPRKWMQWERENNPNSMYFEGEKRLTSRKLLSDEERRAQGLPSFDEVKALTRQVLTGKSKYKTVSEMLDDLEAQAKRKSLSVVEGGKRSEPASPIIAPSAPQFGRLPEVRSKAAIETNVRSASVEVHPDELVQHVFEPGYSGHAKAIIMADGEVRLLKPGMDHPEALTANPAAVWTEGGGMRELARSGAVRVYFDRTSASVSIPANPSQKVLDALAKLSRAIKREDPNMDVYVDVHDAKGKPIGKSRTENYDAHKGTLIDAVEARLKENKLLSPEAAIVFKNYEGLAATGHKEAGHFDPRTGEIVINTSILKNGKYPYPLRNLVAATAHELTHAFQWLFQARMDADKWLNMDDIERLPTQVQRFVLNLLGVPEEAIADTEFMYKFDKMGLGKQIMYAVKKFMDSEEGAAFGKENLRPSDYLDAYANAAQEMRLLIEPDVIQELADILRATQKSQKQTLHDFFFGPDSERGKSFGPDAKVDMAKQSLQESANKVKSGGRITAEEMDAMRTGTETAPSANMPPPIRGSNKDANRSPLGGLAAKVFEKYQGAGGDNGLVKTIQQASGGRFRGIKDFGDAVKRLDYQQLKGMPEQLVADFLTGYMEKGFKSQGFTDDSILSIAHAVAKQMIEGKDVQGKTDEIIQGIRTVGDVEREGQGGQMKFAEGMPTAKTPVGQRSDAFKNFSDEQLLSHLADMKRAAARAKEAYAKAKGLGPSQALDDAAANSKGSGMRLSAVKKEMAARGLKDPDEPSSLPPSTPGLSGGKPEITAPEDGSRGPGGISGVGMDGHPAVGQALGQAISETEKEVAANPIAGGGAGGKRTGGGGASTGGPRQPGGPGPGAPKKTSVLVTVGPKGEVPGDQLKLDLHVEGGLPDHISDIVKGINDFERSLMASSDASFTLNQGWYSMFTHQKEWQKAMIDQFKAMASEKGLEKVNEEINQLPSINLARRTRLALDNSNEFFQSKLIESIKGLGDVVAAGDRAYTAAGNSLRARIFDTFANSWGLMEIESKGITIGPEYDRLMKEANDLADWVNAITGVGTVSDARWNIFKNQQHMFFAAKFLASKVNIMTSPIAYLQQAARGSLPSRLKIGGRDMPMPLYLSPGEASSWRMVAQAWRDTTLYYGGIALTVGALKMMGFDVGTDANQDNFGTVQIGPVVFDLTGGTGRLFSLLWQTSPVFGSGIHVTGSGRVVDLDQGKFGAEDAADLWIRFLTGKLAPLYSQGFQELRGKNFEKQQPTVWDLLPLPISAKVFIETFFDEMWKQHPEIIGASLLNFFGAHSYTRDSQSEPQDFTVGGMNVPFGVLGTPLPRPHLGRGLFQQDSGYEIPLRTR